MRVLVIGSGAREHALAWKLAQSRRVTMVYAAPGNPGIAACAECIPLGASQIVELAEFAARRHIDLTVVGPEVPLVEGIADAFRHQGLSIFGPGAAGANLEGSKAFAKKLMTEAGIPTAQHRTFTLANEAFAYLEEHGAPVVVKADGNAAGKGAIVALDMATAQDAVRQMMVDRVFGAAGDVVVIEDYLQGMGAFTPLPFVDKLQEKRIHEQIIAPTLNALKSQGISFSGVLYSNIMLTERGPMVLEHNTRFGDPETQALMMLLQADLLDVLAFAANRALQPDTLWREGYAVSLTLASGGYPGKYRTGLPITGVEEASRLEGVQVFHAGTSLQDGHLVTAGGRVLSIAAHGQTLQEAVARAYDAAAHIKFEGMHYRRDIAQRGL